MDAAEFARNRLGFEPDERQAEVLRSEAKRCLLACSRQWGKSTVGAAKAVHRAYTRPKTLVVVTSPSGRQSGELLLKAEEFAGRLGVRLRGDRYNRMALRFPNGSRIVGLPGKEKTTRGFTGSLLIIDEAAMVPERLYKALRPVLAVQNGDLWLMSTPQGRQGFFFEEWEYGGDEWLRMAVPATECPRIPAKFLEEEREKLGRLWFAQEYLCEFVDDGTGLFDREVVERAISEGVRPLEM